MQRFAQGAHSLGPKKTWWYPRRREHVGCDKKDEILQCSGCKFVAIAARSIRLLTGLFISASARYFNDAIS